MKTKRECEIEAKEQEAKAKFIELLPLIKELPDSAIQEVADFVEAKLNSACEKEKETRRLTR